MKLFEILGVALRVAGILLFANTLRSIPEVLLVAGQFNEYGLDDGMGRLKFFYYASEFLVLILSLMMIFFPVTMAKFFIPKTDSLETLGIEKTCLIMPIGITLMGVYILTWAIPDLIDNALFAWMQRSLHIQNDPAVQNVNIALVVTIVEIGIGLYCALGASGISRLINKLRG